MNEPHDELMVLLTGQGSPAETKAAVAHVRSCATCQAEAPRLGIAIDALLGGTMGHLADEPPKGALGRMLARARGGRLSYFVSDVAELFDLSLEEAGKLLSRAEGTDGWEEGPGPGVKLLPVTAGPRVGDALTALVKLDAGATFPHHPHLGVERVMVLEGGYRDSQGVEVWRGEVQDMAAATEHSFTSFEGVGCICASRIDLTTA